VVLDPVKRLCEDSGHLRSLIRHKGLVYRVAINSEKLNLNARVECEQAFRNSFLCITDDLNEICWRSCFRYVRFQMEIRFIVMHERQWRHSGSGATRPLLRDDDVEFWTSSTGFNW